MASLCIPFSINSLRVVLTFIVIVWLPSWISHFFFFVVVSLDVFFELLYLGLVNFNIISSIFSSNIRIMRLLTSMMKSWFLLFVILFFVFELLLRLIIKFNLYIFIFLYIIIRFFHHKVVCFDFSFIIFYFTCDLIMINAFEILFNSLFTVFVL